MILSGIDVSSVVPVVSLLIFPDRNRDRVLLGVRKASRTSPRHPDVLSTPTMRIPMSFMTDLLASEPDRVVTLSPPRFETLSDSPVARIGVPYSLASPHAFVAEALICRKLALTPYLVAGDLDGELSLSTIAYDLIHDDEGGYEQTLMLTMSCVLAGPASELPAASPSYSRLDWVDTRQVGDAVRSRNPLLLLPDASPFEVCIHGLCVRSAAYTVDSGRRPDADAVGHGR